ncbi:MAG: hypothetical protein AAB685_02590 [Patescibacteria group bacterium]
MPNPTRDSQGRFTPSSDALKVPPVSISIKPNKAGDSDKGDVPDLVSLRVTNPVTYLKIWWARIMQNEGMDFRFRVRPLTAIAISLIVFSLTFGLGGILLPFNIPFIKIAPLVPSPAPEVLRETGFTGTLKFASNTQKYFLLTQSSEAINLEVPTTIDLSKFVGRRIFASGKYNKATRTLIVSDVDDLEILPQKPVTIPTTPTETPNLTP